MQTRRVRGTSLTHHLFVVRAHALWSAASGIGWGDKQRLNKSQTCLDLRFPSDSSLRRHPWAIRVSRPNTKAHGSKVTSPRRSNRG